MTWPISRRGLLQASAGAVAAGQVEAGPLAPPGWVVGRLTGAQALVEALKAEGVACVFGIPGAQENELWDEFKARGLPYLLAAHEFGASGMADGAARATGRPGVLAVVPGPGVTNALTNLGEAKLDSTPLVAIVGDVADGDKYRPFQVHSLPTVGLLTPVCKAVLCVRDVREIPAVVRHAFRLAEAGEPGPVAVVVPYNKLIEVAPFRDPPATPLPLPFDETAVQTALNLLADRRLKVGVYAGLGCMAHGAALAAAAEVLQAPVATSVSGKGCLPDSHPLAVGWGFGPHAGVVAEQAFRHGAVLPRRLGIDVLLAVGVKFSEVSTGFYGNPRPRHVIHVDAHAANLGQAYPADVCVHADAGLFLSRLVACGESVRRTTDGKLISLIARLKADREREACAAPVRGCGFDPLAVVAALRRVLPPSGLLYTDVTVSEHLAAESFPVDYPRTYFNPVDNQSMGWSLAAAVGGQRVMPGRCVAALTGDGCFLMGVQELSTAAREGLPVKWVVLDDRAYHYMQMLQQPAYRRTTATRLASLDYAAIAKGFGVGFAEVNPGDDLAAGLAAAFCRSGPVLVRVATDYGDRKIRWVEAVRDRFTDELSAAQKARFLARIGGRSVRPGQSD
jgi:acetolactate synthase-1/2/3 large subunit